MRCNNCGEEIYDSNSFCPACGAKQAISPASIFANNNATQAEPVMQPAVEEPEPEKEPGFIRRNIVAIIAIVVVLLIAAAVIVFFALKEKDDDKKDKIPDKMWEEIEAHHQEMRTIEHDQKVAEEEANSYDFDWDLDYDFDDIDDMDAFISAITGGQIQSMSEYIPPEMQDELEEYMEIFQMLDDLDTSNLDEYVDQINQITYDLSGIDISGIYSGDPDAAYDEIMQQMEELFGDDADFSWDYEESYVFSSDTNGDEVVITLGGEEDAEN